MPPEHVHLDDAPRLCGLAAEYSPSGAASARVMAKNTMTSDNPLFYKAVGLASPYLQRAGWMDHWVHSFLILIHDDYAADVYINHVPLSLEIVVKKPAKAGEKVMDRDVADIRNAVFHGISILGSDRVIFCTKMGWKFGLHYDLARTLNPVYLLDVSEFGRIVGSLYRFLLFEHVFRTIEAGPAFKPLKSAGWFPFIEIMADEFRNLAEIYADGRDVEPRVAQEITKFDAARLERMVSHWWRKEPFAKRRTVLEAGIRAFQKGDDDGDILCTKTLITEVEGVARDLHMASTGTARGDFWLTLQNCGTDKAGGESSMYLPGLFADYLRENVLASFNPEEQTVPFSRHSVCHGAAAPEQYTRARALQVILTLDQISYYI
jgi:hypothetical protein